MNCSFLKRNLSKVATIARYIQSDRSNSLQPPRFLEKLINFPITSAPFHPKTFSNVGKEGEARNFFENYTAIADRPSKGRTFPFTAPRVFRVETQRVSKVSGRNFPKTRRIPLAKRRRRLVGWQVESRETFSLLEREGRNENFERIEVEKKWKIAGITAAKRDWHRIKLKKIIPTQLNCYPFFEISSISSFFPFNFPSFLLGTISI